MVTNRRALTTGRKKSGTGRRISDSGLHRKKINISTAPRQIAARHQGGRRGIWLVSFIDYDLGYIDLEQKNLATRQTTRLGPGCHLCLR